MALRSGHGTWGTYQEVEVGRWGSFPQKVEKKQVKSQRSKKQMAVKRIISTLIISSFIVGHQ